MSATPDPADQPRRGQESAEELVDRIFGMPADERRAEMQASVEAAKKANELRRRESEADGAAVELTLSDCGITTGDRLMSLIDDAGVDGIGIDELCRLALDHKIGSRATVYRNCKMLVRDGLILKPEGWDTPRITWTSIVASRYHQNDQ